MAYRTLGNTALSVSPLCLGGNVLGGPQMSNVLLLSWMHIWREEEILLTRLIPIQPGSQVMLEANQKASLGDG